MEMNELKIYAFIQKIHTCGPNTEKEIRLPPLWQIICCCCFFLHHEMHKICTKKTHHHHKKEINTFVFQEIKMGLKRISDINILVKSHVMKTNLHFNLSSCGQLCYTSFAFGIGCGLCVCSHSIWNECAFPLWLPFIC